MKYLPGAPLQDRLMTLPTNKHSQILEQLKGICQGQTSYLICHPPSDKKVLYFWLTHTYQTGQKEFVRDKRPSDKKLYFLCFITNIRLARKNLSGTNELAYSSPLVTKKLSILGLHTHIRLARKNLAKTNDPAYSSPLVTKIVFPLLTHKQQIRHK